MSTVLSSSKRLRGRNPGAMGLRGLAAATPHLILRAGVQLLGGIVLDVALPALVKVGSNIGATYSSPLGNAICGTTIATVIGYYFFRRLSHFPGTRGSSFILPIFLASYGAVFVGLLFLRLNYARFQLLASFLLCVAWFYCVYFTAEHLSGITLALVPGGATDTLKHVEGVRWIALEHPEAELGTFGAVVADLRADFGEGWERFIADCAVSGVPVYHVKQVIESVTGRVEIERLSENTFGSLIPNLAYVKAKEVIDRFVALILIPLLLPLFFFVAIAIRRDSRGPIFFRQTRTGFRGKPFTVFKFRTMTHVETKVDDREAAQTQEDDHRITRLGRTLRRYRIDELPQFLNILRGEMSLIGPRPEALVLSKWYEVELPFYRYRHVVRPGITGWAQINQGHVADVDRVKEKLHFDFYYIKNLSPWLDLLIALKTFYIVMTGFGAK